MSFEYPPVMTLPTELSDEAAAQLLEWLYEFAANLEDHYAAQLRRYYHSGNELPQSQWADDEPPF